MVEIFTKRTELMPADESVEQHKAKRAEEIADVEKDKNGPDGLFKGTFPERGGQLLFDEADGVLRCPHCAHEHEGGPSCLNCGGAIDDDRDGFSDVDDEELDDLELDLDEELQAELGMGLHDHFFASLPRVDEARSVFEAARRRLQEHRHHHHHLHHLESSELSNSEDSELDSEADDDDGGSLQDFVVRDDEEPPRPIGRIGARNRQVTLLSDDESDEGGAISSRRPRRRNVAPSISSPSVAVTDESTNGSEVGDMHSEADLLRHAGWSPLDHGTDSDPDTPNPYGGGYGSTLDGHESDEESDTNTETMIGNGATDDEDDHLRDDMSETPTYGHPDYTHYGHAVYEHLGDDTDDDSSDAQSSVVMDGDGDTEMSVSPDARRSVSVSTNPYRQDSESRSTRELSVSTNYDYGQESVSRDSRETSVSTNGGGRGYQQPPQNLGVANQVHDVADDSSDASIRPPQRRRRPRNNFNARVQQYDPRISMIFAEHQQSVQGTRDRPAELLEELDVWAQSDVRRVVEPASRNRRMTAYRMMPTRRVDPLRSSRSPSATRIISSTDRATRLPRQYVRSRNYN
jgi:hypothetical protein